MRRIWNFIHHLSIPSHRNNFRAKALHPDFLVVVIGIVTVFSISTTVLQSTGVLGFAQDIRVSRLLELTNQERTAQGLPALRYNDSLARAAENKAHHMFTHDYWSHFGGGKTPWDFILSSGYSYEVAGENLAKGFAFSEGVVEGWKNSPTHYANIVRPEYDEIGFAVQNGVLQGEETTLVVQMFGKQLSQAQPVQDDTATQVAQTEEEPQQPIAETQEATGIGTEEPAEAPAEAVAQAEESGQVAQAQSQPVVASSFISLESLKFNWTAVIIGLLLFVLFLDLYFAHKLDLVRLSGKNIAHIIFLSALVVGVLVVKNGVILGVGY